MGGILLPQDHRDKDLRVEHKGHSVLAFGPNDFSGYLKRKTAPNYDIRTVQELLGHKDVKTAMIYTLGCEATRCNTIRE